MLNNYEQAHEIFERATGYAAPSRPFVAIITGVAMPQHQVDNRISPSAPLKHPLPLCVDPPEAAQTIDAPDANGFYPPQFLPCGVRFPRYRWVALHHPNLSSEGYGLRQKLSGEMLVWRQGLFALNTFETRADTKLDYPFVPVGTNVIMSFGPIGALTANPNDEENIAPVPGWGFWFEHTVDPKGTFRCPDIGSGGTGGLTFGCCRIFDNQTGIFIQEFCEVESVCLSFSGTLHGEWQGASVNCPITGEDCGALNGGPDPPPPSEDCRPAGTPGYIEVAGEQPSMRLVASNHELGGCRYGVQSFGQPLVPPIPGEVCG